MMRRQLAHAIIHSNPGRDSLRPFLLALLALFAMPAAAQACAMYVPEEIELMVQVDDTGQARGGLEDLFALIDGESETTAARRQMIQAMVQAGPLAGPDAAMRELAEAMGTSPWLRQAVIGSEDATADAQPQS